MIQSNCVYRVIVSPLELSLIHIFICIKDAYVKQLQEQNKWKEKITETTGKLNEQDKKVWESNKKLAGLNGQLAVEQSKRPSDRSQATINQLQEEIHKTKSVLAVQKDKRDSIQKTLDKQKQYYNESKTFTQNYENLQEAAVSKDKEARKRATIALVNNYKTCLLYTSKF